MQLVTNNYILISSAPLSPNVNSQVGVNIQNDSDKLETDCLCQIKSWVDLRHVAVRSSSWVPCVVAQIDNLEFELQYYNQHDPVSWLHFLFFS